MASACFNQLRYTSIAPGRSTGGAGADPAPPARPPVDVTVVDIKPQDTPAAFEYTGKTESSREVEIRARITGYLDEIAYQEGSLVKQGQLLFQIDPRPFKAELDNAKGELAREQAKLDNARANLARIKPLARENAVSQKDLDDATSAVLAAQAGVQSAKAQVQQAEINLGYTTIRSPLNGLAGRSEKKVGSLISPSDSLLTTVVRLDPIWVNFAVGENELLKYREQTASGPLTLPRRSKASRSSWCRPTVRSIRRRAASITWPRRWTGRPAPSPCAPSCPIPRRR